MIQTPSTRFRAGLALGLSFCLGILVFVIVFQAIQRWGPQPHFPLDPPDHRPAGNLSLPLLTDPGTPPQTWDLKDHAGKIVVVNYFATWCEPCRDELPELLQLARDYIPRGVDFVAVGIDIDNEQQPGLPRETVLRQFAQNHALPFPILLPELTPLWMQMRPGVPQTFLYDRRGRRARAILGAIGTQNLKASLDELLAEK